MAGDPNNVKIWAEADVYIVLPSDIPVGQTILDVLPASINAVLGPLWRPAGLLNGDSGFEESVEWDKTEHTAWGYGVIKLGFKNFKMERKFTTLEENPTVAYLRSKNDTADRVRVSKPADVYLCFEKRTDDGEKHRLFSLMPSTTEYGGRTENESDLPEIEFTSTIVPNADKELFAVQSTQSRLDGEYDLDLTIEGAPTGGTFKVKVNGDETGPLAADSDGPAVKAAMESLATVTGTVTVTGAAGGPFRIRYTGQGPILAGDNSLTGGTSPKISVSYHA